MPIYEYRCQACGRQFDELLRSGSDPTPACPACGTTEVTRLISLIAGLSARSNGGSVTSAGGGCACGGACACGR